MKGISNIKNISIEAICFLYILVFVYAAVSKILDFENFQIQLGQSPLLSAFAGTISWGVIFLEILIAILLVIRKLRIIGLYSAFTLMVMFTVYIYLILNFSSFIPCSCGGILEKLNWKEHIIFNIVVVIIGAIAIVLVPNNRNIQIGRYHFSQKNKYLSLLACLFFGTGIMVSLFIRSENIKSITIIRL